MSDTRDNELVFKQLINTGFYPASDKPCPDCGHNLWEKRNSHWSHDHSYKTGYSLYTSCPHCDYSEEYHDVE